MRVLIVYPSMELYGGAELLVVRLANYLTKMKVSNALLTINISPEIEGDLTGTRIIKYPLKPMQRGLKPLNLFRRIWLLNKGVRRHLKQFDVINVHNYPAEFSVYPYNKRVVWMCNEPPEVEVQFHAEPKYSLRRFVIRAILAFGKHVVRHYVGNVVVADEFNRDRFKNMYGFEPHIINYGVDCNFFSSPPKNGLKKTTSKFTMLHVGILSPMKNQMQSINTIDKLRNSIPDIKLILAGSGDERYMMCLQEQIRSRKLKNHVQITGHLNRERLRKLYHTCDVLLHPIRSQGGWLSPFEALCAKLPIIVSPEMTASNLINKENLGIVTDDFSSAVLDVYKNPEKYSEMAVRRAEWVKANLSWDKFCEKMLNVFFKALRR